MWARPGCIAYTGVPSRANTSTPRWKLAGRSSSRPARSRCGRWNGRTGQPFTAPRGRHPVEQGRPSCQNGTRRSNPCGVRSCLGGENGKVLGTRLRASAVAGTSRAPRRAIKRSCRALTPTTARGRAVLARRLLDVGVGLDVHVHVIGVLHGRLAHVTPVAAVVGRLEGLELAVAAVLVDGHVVGD